MSLREIMVAYPETPCCLERAAQSGKTYQLEMDWILSAENPLRKELTVIVSIDDGGFLSSLFPITRCLTVVA